MFSYQSFSYRWMIAGVLILAGCLGTDLIEDPPVFVPARIELTPATTALEIGANVQFEAAYYDSTGAPATATFTWTSSDASIATIDANGAVTALQSGQAQIAASARGVDSGPALVTVVADPNQIARIQVDPDTVRLEIGGVQMFTARAFNILGNAVNVPAFTWQSSDVNIAIVDSTGRLTARQAGTIHLTATAQDVESMPALVQVLPRSRSGSFQPRPGTSYSVSGTATMHFDDNGQLILEFGDDFQSSSGPGLAVYLSNSNAVGAGSISLAALRRNSGAQTYTLPSNVEITTYNWVIIHCEPFNVTFGFARLR